MHAESFCSTCSRIHGLRVPLPTTSSVLSALVAFALPSLRPSSHLPPKTRIGGPSCSLSPLGIHTHNIISDPRVCLVVQAPGWSGLANASVTIFGDVYELPEESQEQARSLFALKVRKNSN